MSKFICCSSIVSSLSMAQVITTLRVAVKKGLIKPLNFNGSTNFAVGKNKNKIKFFSP